VLGIGNARLAQSEPQPLRRTDMRYLLSLFFCLLTVNAWGFSPGFLSTATHMTTTGGASTFEIRAFDTGTGTSSAECSMSVNSGEKLVVSSTAEQNSGDITIASSPSLTWTSQITQGTPAGGGARARIWTTEATSTGTMTVTTTASSSAGSSCVLYAVTGSESTLGGATANNESLGIQTVPSLAITTTRADSILIAVSGDFMAVDSRTAGEGGSGTARVYRTPPTHTERLFHFASGAYTGYHYTAPATSTASYTLGLTAPTGMSSNTVILEIRKP